MSRLDEIRERLAKATPGPWIRKYDEVRADREGAGWTQHVATVSNEPLDAEFIAHAPEDITYLLSLLGEPV